MISLCKGNGLEEHCPTREAQASNDTGEEQDDYAVAHDVLSLQACNAERGIHIIYMPINGENERRRLFLLWRGVGRVSCMAKGSFWWV